jgi:hypothetical protein
MYDILVAGCSRNIQYKPCLMEPPDIDVFLQSKPGTLIAICGKILRHGLGIGGEDMLSILLL